MGKTFKDNKFKNNQEDKKALKKEAVEKRKKRSGKEDLYE